jgi:hypothetical protein
VHAAAENHQPGSPLGAGGAISMSEPWRYIGDGFRLNKDPFCPHCGTRLDCARTVGKNPSAPVPGDATICFTCGQFLKFGEDALLKLSSQDFLDLPLNVRATLVKARQALIRMKKKMRGEQN